MVNQVQEQVKKPKRVKMKQAKPKGVNMEPAKPEKLNMDQIKPEKLNREPEKPKKLNLEQVMVTVKKEMVELTSLPFNTIAGLALDEETNAPTITIELVERKAIPDSMDLLGIYEVTTDEDGGVRTFRRIGMRKRGDVVSASEY